MVTFWEVVTTPRFFESVAVLFPTKGRPVNSCPVPWVDPGTRLRTDRRQTRPNKTTRGRGRSGTLAAFEHQGALTTGKDGAHLGSW